LIFTNFITLFSIFKNNYDVRTFLQSQGGLESWFGSMQADAFEGLRSRCRPNRTDIPNGPTIRPFGFGGGRGGLRDFFR
jgi:hypothetical protein